jgi:hypothetical protein
MTQTIFGMREQNNSVTDTFFTKLKEQSFTIILLVGILYYQNNNFNNQINEYKKMIDEKETLVLKLTEDERERLLERTKYLQEQRDKFVEQLINKK